MADGSLASLGSPGEGGRCSIVAAATGAPYLLLGHANGVFVHPAASRLLLPLAARATGQRVLHVEPFTPAALAAHLGSSLPASWRGQVCVPWGAYPREAWVHAFWGFLAQQDGGALSLAGFEAWPVLPARRKGERVLLSAKCASCLLRLRHEVVGTQLVEAQLGPRQAAILQLLLAAGAPPPTSARPPPPCSRSLGYLRQCG